MLAAALVVALLAGLLCLASLVVLARSRRQSIRSARLLLAYHARLEEVIGRLAGALGPHAESATASASALRPALEAVARTTDADAAIAVLTDEDGEPRVEAVGLSEWEAARIVEIGFPIRKAARAVEISYAPDDVGEGQEAPPIRCGLAVPVPDNPGGVVAALCRDDHEFSDADVAALERTARLTGGAVLPAPSFTPSLDALTGLYDRHTFHDLLAREGSHADRNATSLTLVMLDVDRLGALNKALGPARADSVLARVGHRLRALVAPSDGYACRIGGGRFGLIVNGDEPAATELFGRVRSSLGTEPPGDTPPVSLSAGIAQRQFGEDAPSLMTRADAALGLAKGSGPGAVVSAIAS